MNGRTRHRRRMLRQRITTHLSVHGWYPVRLVTSTIHYGLVCGEITVLDTINAGLTAFDSTTALRYGARVWRPCEWHTVPAMHFHKLHDFIVDQGYVPKEPDHECVSA